jgi:hypothetical protein
VRALVRIVCLLRKQSGHRFSFAERRRRRAAPSIDVLFLEANGIFDRITTSPTPNKNLNHRP